MKDENTKVIIDASFFLSLILPDEKTQPADQFLKKYQAGQLGLISSPIFPLEVANSIKNALSRRRITLKEAEQTLNLFLGYQIGIQGIDIKAVFNLALEQNLTIYDASYLYLAQKLDAPLLSLDKKLAGLSV